MRIGIFGLDNAGKTTTTKAILGGMFCTFLIIFCQLEIFIFTESLDTVVPTVGFSSFQKKIDQYDVTFLDLGGGKRVRDIWKHYLAEIFGVIFVIDSTEKERLSECKEELSKLLSDPRIQGKPILVYVRLP